MMAGLAQLPTIAIEVGPASDQRYPTVGDWQYDRKTNRLTIRTTATAVPVDAYLVAIHELVEWVLCQAAGISERRVDRWDFGWERRPKAYRDRYGDEPGDDPRAPYHRQHEAAMLVEMQLAHELGLDWAAYEERLAKALADARKAQRKKTGTR